MLHIHCNLLACFSSHTSPAHISSHHSVVTICYYISQYDSLLVHNPPTQQTLTHCWGRGFLSLRNFWVPWHKKSWRKRFFFGWVCVCVCVVFMFLLLKVAAFLSYKLLKCLMEKQNPSKRERDKEMGERERERAWNWCDSFIQVLGETNVNFCI